jgi:hypothetical protein
VPRPDRSILERAVAAIAEQAAKASDSETLSEQAP